MNPPSWLLVAAVLLPLFSAGCYAYLSYGHARQVRGGLACFLQVAALFCWISLAIGQLTAADPMVMSYRFWWIKLPPVLMITFSFMCTPMALVLGAVTLLISVLIHIYSLTYLDIHDRCRARYFALLGLFVSCMLGFIMADNLWSLVFCWGGMSMCSYLLVGLFSENRSVARAAARAYLIGKIGDVALMLGVVLLYAFSANTEFDGIAAVFQSPLLSGMPSFVRLSTFCGLLFALGGLSKAAQLPFLSWLLCAMRGPTPVSALLHSATLVAAGVILLVRLSFLFTPVVETFILVVGLVTALGAGLAACVETHVKRLLAFSTAAQLGFVLMLIALGAVAEALCYLVVHAVAKALLFLSVGRMAQRLKAPYAPDHARSIAAFQLTTLSRGGRKYPLAGLAALASASVLLGVPFSAGALPKDLFLQQALVQGQPVVFFSILALLLTAVYMGRLLAYLFFGKPYDLLPSASNAPLRETPSRWMSFLAAWPLWMGTFLCLEVVFYGDFLVHANVWLFRAFVDSNIKHGITAGFHAMQQTAFIYKALVLLLALFALLYVRRFGGARSLKEFYASLGDVLMRWFMQGMRFVLRPLVYVERHLLAALGSHLSRFVLLMGFVIRFIEAKLLLTTPLAAARTLLYLGQQEASHAQEPLSKRWQRILLFFFMILLALYLLQYYRS